MQPLSGEWTTNEKGGIVMDNNPQHSPGRKNQNPAPNTENKITLVRRIVGLATVSVKLTTAALHLFGP